MIHHHLPQPVHGICPDLSMLTNRLVEEFQDILLPRSAAYAAHKAREELAAVHTDIQKKGEKPAVPERNRPPRNRSCRPSIPY